MATVLHAERDPALFALWGAFVPPHHQVRPTACLRGASVASAARIQSHAAGAGVSTQSQYQARLLSLQTQHAQRAPAVQKPPPPTLSELPGLRRERDELADAGTGGKLQRFSRGPCVLALLGVQALAPLRLLLTLLHPRLSDAAVRNASVHRDDARPGSQRHAGAAPLPG